MKQTRRSKITTTDIIRDFKEVHGNKYGYLEVEYKTMHTKIKIYCSKHGSFEKTPNAHTRQKQGCPKCAGEAQKIRQKDTTENFIRKAKKVHGDKYSYSLTEYGNTAHQKVVIICMVHGSFWQTPNGHLAGSGCNECGNESSGWTRTAWKNVCKSRKGSLYIIKCWNEDEVFYKIGITSRATIQERFYHPLTMPYQYEIVEFRTYDDPLESWELERKLHNINKKHKYTPKIFFDGYSECFLSYAKIH
jgi:hypothetical protein